MLNGRLEKAKGDNDRAMATFNSVIELNPFSIDAYRERAAIKMEQGDKEGYDEDMQKIQEMTPENDEEDIEEKTRQAYKNSNPFG
jgi:tetratricopeptide (TPR) repeat protein